MENQEHTEYPQPQKPHNWWKIALLSLAGLFVLGIGGCSLVTACAFVVAASSNASTSHVQPSDKSAVPRVITPHTGESPAVPGKVHENVHFNDPRKFGGGNFKTTGDGVAPTLH